VECKLRCVNFRSVSDPRRAFRPAFAVTEISDDWYRSTMGVIVTSLGTPRSAGENFGCTWEHLGVPGSACDKSGSTDDMPRSAADKSGNTTNHNRAV